ncbi:uncharacterized protein Eint_021220 [Encephalitozoon intestinalis ATCC 50506]|uniref:Uncharacterized protein n=1 Tax=Encephalitozoon intestinalis (strain ATCC 50506) TaxID=876142 RepID=E0S5Y4_ENCIT|nr:uncharacterized protein Eint_021220 [Encephalitozoon intestinalis ATCC 50506]ADM11119.1 hypothetical protein Eint_021220 [Encephalitozoon intestinalis ATCC 50506]UTX44773.1 hypothetical protein GPK93_02g02930 [Encephalitozoon intestinalis]
MIIRIDRKHISSSIEEWFQLLKSNNDSLEDGKTSGCDPSMEYEIEVKESIGKKIALVTVNRVGIKHEVSLDKIEETLLEVVGTLLGHELVVIHGFTVKDQSGEKTKPIIPIFFRSTLGIQIPKRMGYLKNDGAGIPEIDESMMVPFVHTSPILKSLLNSRPLRFSGEGVKALLVLYNGSTFIIPDTARIIPMIRGMLSREKMGEFLKLLKKFPFKFVETFIKAYMQPSSLEVNKELSGCFSEFQNNLTKLHIKCIHKIVSNAPVFLDARDKITERIEKFYIYNAKGFKRKRGEYLKCREELYIDKNPIGSLKRYFRDL